MNVSSSTPPSLATNDASQAMRRQGETLSRIGQADNAQGEDELREVFTDFVGQALFGQMLSAMRSTVGKPAYFHGGRGEEVFQGQLDQALVEKISDASADQIADPMYELFRLGRQ